MIHTSSFVFIHVPKTGGMSVTRFLVNALDEPVTIIAPNLEHSFGMAASDAAREKLDCKIGLRHETPKQAIAVMAKNNLTIPPFAFSVIRHPVDLMLSYYKHMRKPATWKVRGMTEDTLSGPPLLAMENDFDSFCEIALFYGFSDSQLASYYQPSGFPKLDVVPLNALESYLVARFSHNRNFDLKLLEHRNRSTGSADFDQISQKTRALILETYPETVRIYEDAVRAPQW